MLTDNSPLAQIFKSGEMNNIKKQNILLRNALINLAVIAGETTTDLVAFDGADLLDAAIDSANKVIADTMPVKYTAHKQSSK